MIRTINAIVAVILGGVVTFSLFFLMQMLIATGDEVPERQEGMVIADITIPEQELEIQRREPKPPEPEQPDEMPELPEPDFNPSTPNVNDGISISRVNIDQGPVENDATISPTDAEYLPIVTVPAQYPTRALQRGIEGWCQVMFTVNENGGVENPRVVDAEPPNIFDRASLRAVSRFKFNPRTVDGEPVKTHGVQYVFRFTIEDED